VRLTTCIRLVVFFAGLTLVAGCSSPVSPPEETDEPLFGPGDYGGDALPGTEYLTQLTPSPDGSRFALVRQRTPGTEFSPRKQLWIVDADGGDPEFIGVNTGGVFWHPDGEHLAVNVVVGTNIYLYTLDLARRETRQWSGADSLFFNYENAAWGGWFADGRRLLVSVFSTAYQQAYARGLYVLDTETGEVEGPLLELMEAARLGGRSTYVTGQKFVYPEDPLFEHDGNYARYDLATGAWRYITDVPTDSIYTIGTVPSPVDETVVLGREVENVNQLFLMNSDGSDARRITESGGNGPRWAADGSEFFFIRDVHRGAGAHWIPFAYDLSSGEERVLWPALPDSVPMFPPLPPPGEGRLGQ
jgi:Tol biopolymer transport system component